MGNALKSKKIEKLLEFTNKIKWILLIVSLILMIVYFYYFVSHDWKIARHIILNGWLPITLFVLRIFLTIVILVCNALFVYDSVAVVIANNIEWKTTFSTFKWRLLLHMMAFVALIIIDIIWIVHVKGKIKLYVF